MDNRLREKPFNTLSNAFGEERSAHSTKQIVLLMFGQHHRFPYFTKARVLRPLQRAVSYDPPMYGRNKATVAC